MFSKRSISRLFVAAPAVLMALLLAASLPYATHAHADEVGEAEEADVEVSLPANDGPGFFTSQVTDEDIASTIEMFETIEVGATSSNFYSDGPDEQLMGSVSLAGQAQYDTAAQEAIYAFESSRYAIIASGTSAVDALSATSLAGALDCPILLTAQKYLPSATAEALKKLGVSEVIIVGGSFIVQQPVADALEDITGSEPLRIAGDSLFDTQMAVYQYGVDLGCWGTTAIIANGSKSFADALSISPVAFKLRAPVFLANNEGMLPLASSRALIAGGFNRVVVVGGTSVVSDRMMGIAEAAAIMGGGEYGDALRLAGDSLYDTSAEVAGWAVSEGILSWDGAAFATGRFPYDALAGSAVQGREGSVLLLIDEGYDATLNAALENSSEISYVKFFGGNAVVKPETRNKIITSLSLSNVTVAYQEYAITLNKLARMEATATPRYTVDEILENLDPNNYDFGDWGYYQFADLSSGYSGVSAEKIDAFIAKFCGGNESKYDVESALRGEGAAFVAASRATGINEIYLLAHALLESAWGCSPLANGTYYDGKGFYYDAWDSASGTYVEKWYDFPGYEKGTYYNFFGYGAYDSSPFIGGITWAIEHEWNSPEAALTGAADVISNSWINPPTSTASGVQNTLWKMKWDAQRAATEGSVWHQYATSRDWAEGIAITMGAFYNNAGMSFERTGHTFIIPVFAAE